MRSCTFARYVMQGALVACAVMSAAPAGAGAEQASQPDSAAAAGLDAGRYHTCALLDAGSVRCWGFGTDGQLGYASTGTIGDDETPGSVGPVNLGAGRTAKAVSSGDSHTCALLDDGSVRCWGFGAEGRLGYGNTASIGDDEPPGSVGPVKLGAPATAISAGGGHTCAILADGSVRCWGFGSSGQLGYGNTSNVGDRQTPDSVGAVDLGPGRTAKAISAGIQHTCALLDDATVRCWGFGGAGRLGYSNQNTVQSPAFVGPVDLGPGRKAKAISAGGAHTCALLDDGTVRCWGFGASGQLGYGGTDPIGDDETPGSVGPVGLGPGRKATAISAGRSHTCAVLDDGTVRCWGYGGDGELGYASTSNIGDDETPDAVGPVDLGSGRIALAITASQDHTCARLDDASVRCWGYAGNGQLGSCNANNVGDDESPGSVAPIALTPGIACPSPGGGSGGGGSGTAPGTLGDQSGGGGSVAPPAGGAQGDGGGSVDPLAIQAQRARDLRICLKGLARRKGRERSRARRVCLKRYGRTPGPITGLRARAASKTEIALSFRAPGSDGSRPPAARAYLVKQSPRPIRGARDFARAQTLCKGSCRFSITRVGTRINLTITDLLPNTTYYYALAARDNVSGKLGSRSTAVKARTRR